MIDFGFDKLALIGAVALIVIGPERLPKVARTVGHLMGKAQRYVQDVKAEVNRSMELEELKKMKTEVESAARNVEQTIHREASQFNSDLQASAGWQEVTDGTPPPGSTAQGVVYQAPRKNWRLKRGATPQWYKQRMGVRTKAQSGAARVARFRPPRRPL